MATRLALLTGATGFVGGHLARALIAEGWHVRALARGDPSRSPLLEGLPLEIVRADLSSGADLASAASGCDAVVHAAGRLKARTLEEYREVNLRGTQRLLAAAAGVAAEAMFVLVSSQAAAGPAREGRPVGPDDPARPVSWYGISKLEGEAALRAGWKGPWVVLRPGVIYGPGDRGLLAYFRMASSGWLPVPAASSHIQIGAAAQVSMAVARAAGRRDLHGRTAFLCDPEPVTVGALAACIASLPAKRARLFPVPGAAVRALGLAETLREKLTGRSRAFNADKARELLAGEWTCEAGLRQELELPPPLPLQSGLRETWDWYSRQGWLNL
ncbi:MAG TPA: NAD(P)-dependent oxidoreductase [Thermoanaerobaculia bacterium]|nr:NAD(P)-dependent oxidoreductase [Thermoanaerobaculia bacterium]